MFTIVPPSFIMRSASCATKYKPRVFTENMKSGSSGVHVARVGIPFDPRPALFPRMSSAGYWDRTVSNIAAICSRSLTSAQTARAVPPACWMPVTISSAPAVLRE